MLFRFNHCSEIRLLAVATLVVVGNLLAVRASVGQEKPTRLPPISVRETAPSDSMRLNAATVEGTAAKPESLDWWQDSVTNSVLDVPRWVTFDLETIVLDTLRDSPRIQSVSREASIALEQIVQQDAAFDPTILLESRVGRSNDPVGNSLVTGGPPRLIEESWVSRGGITRTTRRGTVVDMSQEMGLLTSNSEFFEPGNQGNSRLGVSLTQPLLSRSGKFYNERLLTQARIDSKVSWQEMRGAVEQRVADVIVAYWRLYELRCHLLQQEALLKRGERIEAVVQARRDFDAGRIELAKARQRVARRVDRQLLFQAEIKKQQARLASLVGSAELAGSDTQMEMIPLEEPVFPDIRFELRDAVVQGLENRPEVRAAAEQLESAALAMQVTRAELVPQLSAVVDTYLSGLNGNFNSVGSVTDQFTRGGPGLAAGLRYDMPYGRRAAKSRHREANHQYHQRSEELREVIQLTRAEIESALIDVETAMAQKQTKHRLLVTALDEERILTRRWEMMAGDGATVGTVLETLLDAQQRRTDAEREWISAHTTYLSSLVDLQRAMGTLLIRRGIQPMQPHRGSAIDFVQTNESSHPTTALLQPTPPPATEPEARTVENPQDNLEGIPKR